MKGDCELCRLLPPFASLPVGRPEEVVRTEYAVLCVWLLRCPWLDAVEFACLKMASPVAFGMPGLPFTFLPFLVP